MPRLLAGTEKHQTRVSRNQFALASVYYDGKGVPQDYAEAARWYRKAAEQGGCRRTIPRQYSGTRKAAYQGNAEAEYDLGYMYYYGHKACRRIIPTQDGGAVGPPTTVIPKLDARYALSRGNRV